MKLGLHIGYSGAHYQAPVELGIAHKARDEELCLAEDAVIQPERDNPLKPPLPVQFLGSGRQPACPLHGADERHRWPYAFVTLERPA